MNTKISIIIPIYNVEKYVRKCLESVFYQDVDERLYEVIVVNDGTKDSSMDVVKPILAKHSNVRLIEQENHGLSIARNIGLNASKGDYVWFVDSDDMISQNALEILFHYIEQTHAEVYTFGVDYINESGEKCGCEEAVTAKRHEKYYNHVDTGFFYERKLSMGISPKFLFERKFLLNNNLYFLSGIFHEDMDFQPRVFAYVQRIHPLREHLYVYLRRKGSITTTPNPKRYTDRIKIIRHLNDLATQSHGDIKKYHLFMDAVFTLSSSLLLDNSFLLQVKLYIEYKAELETIAKHSFWTSIFAYPSPKKIKDYFKIQKS